MRMTNSRGENNSRERKSKWRRRQQEERTLTLTLTLIRRSTELGSSLDPFLPSGGRAGSLLLSRNWALGVASCAFVAALCVDIKHSRVGVTRKGHCRTVSQFHGGTSTPRGADQPGLAEQMSRRITASQRHLRPAISTHANTISLHTSATTTPGVPTRHDQGTTDNPSCFTTLTPQGRSQVTLKTLSLSLSLHRSTSVRHSCVHKNALTMAVGKPTLPQPTTHNRGATLQ